MLRPFLILALAALQLTRSALPVATDRQFYEVFGNYLESLRSQGGIPAVAAAVIGPTGIVWQGAFGKEDVERSIAARTDTLFHLDGQTEIFTASLVLRCVEEGRLSLDDRIGQFDPSSPDANLTIGQLLTHTDGATGSATFLYRPERLAPLAAALRRCTGPSFRGTVAGLLEQFAMFDSVPGADAPTATPPDQDISKATLNRYVDDLARLAVPYVVDKSGRASPSRYTATTLTPSSGLISTVLDYAQFDLALKRGWLLRPESLAVAWSPPLNRDGHPVPHGVGWFVQTYKSETIVWQFGVSDNVSSSLVMSIPARGVTLIIVANSDGLVKPFALSAGDLAISPFGQLFLGAFVR